LYLLIGPPEDPFRDIEGGAVLINIYQLGLVKSVLGAVVETYRISEIGPVTSSS
jgi:hypothetical protein